MIQDYKERKKKPEGLVSFFIDLKFNANHKIRGCIILCS